MLFQLCAPEVVALRCDPVHIWDQSSSAPQQNKENSGKEP
ncbi:hypothetical protein APTSU1_001332500 [Apodemus speciosus]|uniref:Uncharacterized protein n=1 Tax=Apodemus speciosus TaxID=105296 RepID=A0ABQ0FFS2_APOSI